MICSSGKEREAFCDSPLVILRVSSLKTREKGRVLVLIRNRELRKEREVRQLQRSPLQMKSTLSLSPKVASASLSSFLSRRKHLYSCVWSYPIPSPPLSLSFHPRARKTQAGIVRPHIYCLPFSASSLPLLLFFFPLLESFFPPFYVSLWKERREGNLFCPGGLRTSGLDASPSNWSFVSCTLVRTGTLFSVQLKMLRYGSAWWYALVFDLGKLS